MFPVSQNMNSMFEYAAHFNQAIESWDVAAVRDMSYMFYGENPSTGPSKLGMFRQCRKHELLHVLPRCTLQPSHWIVGCSGSAGHELHVLRSKILQQAHRNLECFKCRKYELLVLQAAHFNQAIGSWDIAAVRDMSFMFWGAKSFNRPIGSWNVSRVPKYESLVFARPLQSLTKTSNHGTHRQCGT